MQAKAVQTSNMAKTEGIKRKLKPVMEKKRRDRINHNLDALKDLLFKTTADTRLQNPKLEKAEILDLAVQYIRKSTRKTETKVTSNQMDSKATKIQSVSDEPIYTTDIQVSDVYGRLNPSERNEALQKLESNPVNNITCAFRVGNEPANQTQENIFSQPGQNYHRELLLHPESSLYACYLSSSSHYNSPPSSPTFNNVFSCPSNSPPYPSSSCLVPFSFPLPPPPDMLSPLTTPTLSFHRPVPTHAAKDLTPPQSPVLALRQEHFPLPAQSTWRPWS